MAERYIASDNADWIEHGCCYDAAVFDTQAPTGYEPKPYERVCECFDLATAQTIASTLNAAGPAA